MSESTKPLWMNIAYSLLHGVLPTGVGIAYKLFLSSDAITANWTTVLLYAFMTLLAMSAMIKLVYWMAAHDTQVMTFVFTCFVCYMIVSTCNSLDTRCVEGYQFVSSKISEMNK